MDTKEIMQKCCEYKELMSKKKKRSVDISFLLYLLQDNVVQHSF